MIRFRNPGTQYTTQVQVFRELYKEYKDAPSFDLDDMAATIQNEADDCVWLCRRCSIGFE